MSIYFSDANEDSVFGASNTGWGDVCRWVEAQKITSPLRELCNGGWAAADGVVTAIDGARIEDAPKDVKTVLQTLRDFAEAAEEIVMIGDGMVSNDKSSDVKRAETNALEPWSESDLDELCTIEESDIQAAANSATPKLRDLKTAPPAS